MKEDAFFGIIYKVTNLHNQKSYIGQTVKPLAARRSRHMYDAFKRSRANRQCFANALRKYGDDEFTWKIIEGCDSKEEMNLAEEWYIRYYRTYIGFSNCNGYNLTLGGEGPTGYKHKRKARIKISEAGKGSKRRVGKWHTEGAKKRISVAKTGKKLPPFTKIHSERMSKAIKGTKHSKESVERQAAKLRKKYVITFPFGEEFIVCGLMRFCREYKVVDLMATHLSGCAVGRCKHHKKYKCRYYDTDKDIKLTYHRGS
jgi:group I intron endonuclease